MVLFGLVDYLAASQELNADFDVDVSLNGASIGKRHFTAADAASGADLTMEVTPPNCKPAGNAVQVTKHGSWARILVGAGQVLLHRAEAIPAGHALAQPDP